MITTDRVWPQAFPFQQFHVLFNSLSKVLFIFPSRYLFAIGLSPIFSFRWNLPPILSCIPKQLDSLRAHHKSIGSPCPTRKTLLQTTTRTARGTPDFKFELFPLHSQLLGESLLVSFPPLIDMLKFSGFSCLISDQSFELFILHTQN